MVVRVGNTEEIPRTSFPGEEPVFGSLGAWLAEAVVEMAHSDPFHNVQCCRKSWVSFMR